MAQMAGKIAQQKMAADAAKQKTKGNLLGKMQNAGQESAQQKQGLDPETLAALVQSSGWMNNAQSNGPQVQLPQQQQNWASGISNALQGVGQEVGKVRQGVFDFAGLDKNTQSAINNGVFQRSQPMQPMPMSPLRGVQTSGGSNDAIINTFNQTMQALKQKRGF